MATITINPDISGDSPASVSLRSLTDAGTGADVSGAAGLTLPAALSGSGTVWSITFTDVGAAEYAYVYRMTFSDGFTADVPGTIYGNVVSADGCDATSSDLDDWYGVENITAWSCLSGSTPVRDNARIARALAYARDEVAAYFSNGPYQVNSGPYVSGTSVFGYLDTASQSKVKKWEIVIATAWLIGRRWLGVENNSQTEGPSATVNSDINTIRDEMAEYLAGDIRRLNVTQQNANQPTGPVVLTEDWRCGGHWPAVLGW